MANENEKNPSALEELRQLKRTDRIKSLNIHEPELHDFHAENVFHIDEEPEKKTIFGKRSARTHVKINQNIFDDEVAESVDITPVTPIEEVEAPIEKHVVEETSPIHEDVEQPKKMEPQPVVEEEVEPKKVVEKMDVDEDFTTESIEKELKGLNNQPVKEEEDDYPIELEADEEEEAEQEDVEIEDLDDEDLYEERKSFLYAEYPKIEAYLQEKSREGYHFVRQEGKKYFFRKGAPKTYYYSMNYYVNEPDADQWRDWEADGWKLVSKSDGKKKSDAGWFTFRNEEEDGEYRKEIDNDSEKYRFFRKYSSSCRSTMFLVFICMACCVVTGLLQVYYKGYLASISLCGALFLISFIVFCTYGRMLRKSKKRARELKSKLRLRESRINEERKDFYDTSESEEELDTDWNTLEQHTGKEKKHLFRRVDRDEEDEE
ncbi:DUF2812 domain-containing protein [uncultured Holdemanella sp.]|uniref:DUF2812 domain-containing protein n=1 Tax=uncultured Holdemanella sp. TaxID=1763549 RepID=UPI0025E91FF8|nr:DUF2812 domain-containing protein [uncultured Holdemanella sp.]